MILPDYNDIASICVDETGDGIYICFLNEDAVIITDDTLEFFSEELRRVKLYIIGWLVKL